jgi:hypothetical protein
MIFRKNSLLAILIAYTSISLVQCTKEKVPIIQPMEPTKWEKISGDYKVYDTNEVYLYEMEISHFQSTDQFGNPVDSLEFMNFDNNFTFKTQQDFYESMVIQIVSPDPIKDNNNKSWELYGISPDSGDNEFISDTIRLKFNKNNFSYYLSDLVPYYFCVCKQVAIKQH